MKEFTIINKNNVCDLKKYFDSVSKPICDLSIGVRYLWRDFFKSEFCIYNDTLIMKESSDLFSESFYFPIGKDVDGALKEIEKYVREKNIPLSFCWITNIEKEKILSFFDKGICYFLRDWSDYIYDAESFKNFCGKKYSGQRNHINKFKGLYPNYKVKIIEEKDVEKILELLSVFKEEKNSTSNTALAEYEHIVDYVENMFSLSQLGIAVEVDGKFVGVSIGEKVNDSLIVHVEKALYEYEGVYPFLSNEFVKTFKSEEIKYLNREEDCGLEGLRISKTQYHPIEILEKNTVVFSTPFESVDKDGTIFTKRLTLSRINEKDKNEYFEICVDETLNKLWGYDYKEDLKEEPTPEYFYSFMKGLEKKKEEFSYAVRLNGKMIGEVVLHAFDDYGGVEIGFRLKKEYQGFGYATEAVNGVKDLLLSQNFVKKIKGKCFLENEKSKKLFTKAGFVIKGKDDRYYYFEKTL